MKFLSSWPMTFYPPYKFNFNMQFCAIKNNRSRTEWLHSSFFYTSSELFFQCWDEHAFTASGTKHQEAETSLISHSLFPLTVAIAVGELPVCSWVYTLILLLQPVRSDVCRAHLSSSVAFGSLSDLPAVGNNMSACLVVANRLTPQLASRCPLIDRRRCTM